MVVNKKPVPTAFTQPMPSRNPSPLPYPESPDQTKHPADSSFSNLSESRNESPWRSQEAHLQAPSKVPSASDVDDGWADGGMDRSYDRIAIPSSLRIGQGLQDSTGGSKDNMIPSSSRVGPPEGTPRTSSESTRSRPNVQHSFASTPERSQERKAQPTLSTNPFIRARSSERPPPAIDAPQEESSVDVWSELASSPPPPTSAPPPPPSYAFEGGFESSSLHEYPGQETVVEPFLDDSSPVELDGEDTFATPSEEIEKHALDHHSTNQVDGQSFQNKQVHGVVELQTSGMEINILELHSKDHQQLQHDRASSMRQDVANENSQAVPKHSEDEPGPALPPRTPLDAESPPTQPPRPRLPTSADPTQGGSNRLEAGSQATITPSQRSETYQIKHIRWFDNLSSNNIRTSPIMVQNANGPCPLLALVNALTLSTPAHLTTALVETLRVREQVSLGLLLDAVFDELMSGRRGDAAQELPDVGDLYTFLITLHTGMNVNPCFVPSSSDQPNLMDARNSEELSAVSTSREAGQFENTKEMKLYSAFAIRLIHGWLPPRAHPAYQALQRSARTYEDAQNLMFREEELEEKLQLQGLTESEQLLLEDIASVKYFLSTSATQLTGYGLDTITDTLYPGAIAILFRNDHFSTLYKHPESGQLMTLVTDMGYAGHEEIVWESLVDVNGENCEFFAGDFRPVGHVAGDTNRQPNNAAADHAGPWTTVSHSRSANPPDSRPTIPTSSLDSPEPYNLPSSPAAEQEDADLALAMQLQEEEEDRSRRETAARRREDQLSQAYLESQPDVRSQPRRTPTTTSPTPPTTRAQIVRPLVPPRGGSASINLNTPTQVSPAVNRDPEAGEDAPPPTYEQASKTLPYHPPPGTDIFPPMAPSGRQQGNRPRQSSAYSSMAATDPRRSSGSRVSGPIRGGAVYPGAETQGIARRRSGAGAGTGYGDEERERQRQEGERDRDCTIM